MQTSTILSRTFIVSALLVAPGNSVAGSCGQQPSQVEAVRELDLSSYAGCWFEISRFPNGFQDDCAGEVTATYRLREDGRIDVINECAAADGESKRATGVAKLAAKDGPASKLKVRFAPRILSWLPFVWADYWVLALDDDYTHAAVGTPNLKYLWILSRSRQMSESDYTAVVEHVDSMGFAVQQLEHTRQTATGRCPGPS
jgi:apolipoprotein D and lipocalin family protein